jgi:CxxC motif-containing protein (DUF1111 family)
MNAVRYMAALAALGTLAGIATAGQVEDNQNARRQRFRNDGIFRDEDTPAAYGGFAAARRRTADRRTVSEAPTGFDNLTNGYLRQGPPYESLDEDTVQPGRSFNDNRFVFEEVETIADGLGPVYNAQSCRECHQNVVTGGASQVAEHRTGRVDAEGFFESLGGSLIQSRATYAELVERVAFEDDVRTFRISTNTLGDGFVECVANSTLLAIRDQQPAAMRGTALMVPVLEANSSARVGRFGWKCQHASLESFAADAYVNEMGITSPLFPDENTSSGRFVGYGSGFDPLPEPEDDGTDLTAFADFMRATKAPPRAPASAASSAGERLFTSLGCAVCHVTSMTTAHVGSATNGGSFIVPASLGDKTIHPYSDFLLHDIGTGDGIPFLPTPELQSTASQIRTAPLWALRTRNRLMHDGLSFTFEEAIQRHAGQASAVTAAYRQLSDTEKAQIRAFLNTL